LLGFSSNSSEQTTQTLTGNAITASMIRQLMELLHRPHRLRLLNVFPALPVGLIYLRENALAMWHHEYAGTCCFDRTEDEEHLSAAKAGIPRNEVTARLKPCP
jgi:hypothetical protein